MPLTTSSWILHLCCLYLSHSSTTNTNLNVDVLTHLGNSTNEYSVSSVTVLTDGTIVIAADGDFQFKSPYNCQLNSFLDDSSITPLSSKLITIERESQSQFTITSILNVADSSINDICSNDNNVAIIGPFGVIAATYSNNLNSYTIQWKETNFSYSCSSDCKCDMSSDNTIIAYVGSKTTNIYDWTTGEIVASTTTGKSSQDDVAISRIDGTNYFYRIGWHQILSNLQVPWIFASSLAYYLNGESQIIDEFTLYNEDGTSTGDTSDTRGVNIVAKYNPLNQRTDLWYTGYSSGGVSVFRRDPNDLTTNANNINYDLYTQTSNTNGDAKLHYSGVANAVNGSFYRGQYMVMRLTSSSKANTLSPTTMDVDYTLDKVYYGQKAACCLENRDILTVNNVTVGAYSGSDGIFAITNVALTERLYWTVFTDGSGGDSPKSDIVDISVNNGVMALVGTVQDGGAVIEVNKFEGTVNHDTGDSGFLVIIDEYYGDDDGSDNLDNELCGVAPPTPMPTMNGGNGDGTTEGGDNPQQSSVNSLASLFVNVLVTVCLFVLGV